MFVDAIVGEKGSGKTPVMLDMLTKEAKDANANIVFVEYGHSVNHHIPHSVRFIDITEYPIHGYDQLIAFVAGMNAKDYDISHIFIDSIFKVAGDDKMKHLPAFMRNLEALARRAETKITVAISCNISKLPELPETIAIIEPSEHIG